MGEFPLGERHRSGFCRDKATSMHSCHECVKTSENHELRETSVTEEEVGSGRGRSLVSKQSSDQSPPLGLDPREGGAGLCADRLEAKWGVPAFPSQQEVHTS